MHGATSSAINQLGAAVGRGRLVAGVPAVRDGDWRAARRAERERAGDHTDGAGGSLRSWFFLAAWGLGRPSGGHRERLQPAMVSLASLLVLAAPHLTSNPPLLHPRPRALSGRQQRGGFGAPPCGVFVRRVRPPPPGHARNRWGGLWRSAFSAGHAQ